MTLLGMVLAVMTATAGIYLQRDRNTDIDLLM